MNDSLDYIDSYFKGEIPDDELNQFDQRIIEDPVFAEEVSFYLNSFYLLKTEVKEEKKSHFRELYREKEYSVINKPVNSIWPYLSAAAFIAAVSISIFLFYPDPSPQRAADLYVKEHLSTLGVVMTTRTDSIQTAISLYNEGKLAQSLLYFENLIASHPSEYKLKEYAGIVSLRLGNYDKALKYFRDLEGYTGLFANPGKFYVALTLLKRHLPGDTDEAKTLLRQVVKDGLDKDHDAKALLEEL